jgi:hypothetical protein
MLSKYRYLGNEINLQNLLKNVEKTEIIKCALIHIIPKYNQLKGKMITLTLENEYLRRRIFQLEQRLSHIKGKKTWQNLPTKRQISQKRGV